MIERKFVSQNVREFQVKTYLFEELTRAGLADVKLQRTPLGDKIVVHASRPGLVVGKGGANIAKLTADLKNKFGLENPQIEIEEVKDFRGNAAITAEMIANSLERFGTQRFKGVGHKTLQTVMESGALGVEISISGKIPSSRAKTWRFYQGYLKKCGDISVSGVYQAKQVAKLKTGIVGIQVKIMPGTTILPDKIELLETPITIIEEIDLESGKVTQVTPKTVTKKTTAKKSESKPEAKKVEKKVEAEKKAPKKTTTKKSESKKN
jgi:small subunit ribosomal protein S3